MPIVLPILPEPSPSETGPYCVIAKHRALPGRADAYEQRMLADLEHTRAEPGALQFHIHRDRFDPNVFVIYEVWKDLGALRKHFDMPYVRQFVTDSADFAVFTEVNALPLDEEIVEHHVPIGWGVPSPI
jgi:quinol monooxygenase YgiN